MQARCPAVYPYKVPSTTNMRDHYIRNHAHIKITSEETEPNTAENKNPSPISNWLRDFSKEKFRYFLTKWICCSNQPFTTCEQPEFRELLQSLRSVTVPGADTIRKDINLLFRIVESKVIHIYSNLSSSVAISQDAWSSKAMYGFMGIFGHFITMDWELCEMPINFCHLTGSHSGKNLADAFIQSVLPFKIKDVSCIVCDNASSNDTFMTAIQSSAFDKIGFHGFDSNQQRQRCILHCINLISQTFLTKLFHNSSQVMESDGDLFPDDGYESTELPDFEKIGLYEHTIRETNPLNKLRKLIKKIRTSVQMTEKFNHLCAASNLPILSVILDVETRWNSTYDMACRCVTLKIPLQEICLLVPQFSQFQLSISSWGHVEILADLLRPLKKLTDEFSQSKKCTLGELIPKFNSLIDYLEDLSVKSLDVSIREAALAASKKAMQYYGKTDLSDNSLFAMILNPRIKMAWIEVECDKSYYKKAYNCLLDAMVSVSGVSNPEILEFTSNSNDENLEEWEKIAVTKKRKSNSAKECYENELKRYLFEPRALKTKDYCEMKWWKANHTRFPILSKLSRNFLAIPASSVSVERWFSGARDLLSLRRSSLSPETIRKCMLLRMWLQGLPIKYEKEIMVEFCQNKK